MNPYDLALAIMRSRAVGAVSRRLTKNKLRILAYHGVPDPTRFDAQMTYVANHYTPVDEGVVHGALVGAEPLPEGAVWVTFDDGDPSVVVNALPSLERLSIPATMYVCPGLIDANVPFWWRIAEWASEHETTRAPEISGDADLTEYLKTVSDDKRRTVIEELSERVPAATLESWRQLTDAELQNWTSAGLSLGNHSWDHPCLDRCSEAAQREQVTRTHEWLTARLGSPPLSFAYPNGNFAPTVETALSELEYDLAVLYDNQLTSADSHPLRLSRLMVEAEQPVERIVGVLSGAQPALAKLTRR